MDFMKTLLFISVLTIFMCSCSSYDRYDMSSGYVSDPLRPRGYGSSVETDDRLSPLRYSNKLGVHSVSYNPTVPVSYSDEKESRKILFSAYFTVNADEPDTTTNEMKNVAKKFGGYVQESGSHRTIIRIRSNQLHNAIKDIELLGDISDRNIVGNDVTEEYFDIKLRQDNALKARERYLQLLEKAENVEAALKVEKELERLNETIENLKGKINKLDHLTEYSTITITVKRKSQPGILGYVFVGLYHSVKWLFVMD